MCFCGCCVYFRIVLDKQTRPVPLGWHPEDDPSDEKVAERVERGNTQAPAWLAAKWTGTRRDARRLLLS